MDKYTLLILLNIPFVIFGFIKAISMFSQGQIRRGGFAIRLVFWAVIAFCLVFAEDIYNFLAKENLTDSPPLSIADVVLVTGVVFCLFLSMRAYAKIDILEKRLTALQERLSIQLSSKNKK